MERENRVVTQFEIQPDGTLSENTRSSKTVTASGFSDSDFGFYQNTAAKRDIALEVWKLRGGGAVVISPGMWRLLMQDFVATEIFLQN